MIWSYCSACVRLGVMVMVAQSNSKRENEIKLI
jgi:hypothetical protein